MNILQPLLAPLKRFWQDLPTTNEDGYLVYSDNSTSRPTETLVGLCCTYLLKGEFEFIKRPEQPSDSRTVKVKEIEILFDLDTNRSKSFKVEGITYWYSDVVAACDSFSRYKGNSLGYWKPNEIASFTNLRNYVVNRLRGKELFEEFSDFIVFVDSVSIPGLSLTEKEKSLLAAGLERGYEFRTALKASEKEAANQLAATNMIAMFMGVNKDANESGEVATAPIEVKEHENDEKPEEVAGVLTPVELPRSRRDGKTPRRSAVGD